jgi:heterodisulfide reductase subunit C
MLSLKEAEQFVKENGHLYGVKSYAKIKENKMNIDLAEMTTKNLEKIEELFLYIIELKNENIELRKEVERLKSKKN